ncbi:MAG: Rrf2 family transcriptional regulator [Alphaproteobacteria bacterium]|nr:Rrf2 family transcriptional regulator [Alphaproteobacteria bacterium]
MLRLSRKTMLALEAVVDIAINARPDPVQSKEITQRQGIPQRYLEQVMQNLVHAGILKGVRGPRGGYRLAKERRRITVGDVVRVVSLLEANAEPQISGSSAIGDRIVKPLVEKFHTQLMHALDDVTIEDLCHAVEREGLTEPTPGVDFTI